MAVMEKVQTSAERSAARRRNLHRRRLATLTGRDRLWAAIGWLMAEARRQPETRREQVTAQVVALAERLNQEVTR